MENLPDPVTLIVFFGALSMLPFVVVMGTSFVKLVIVFSLVRNAMGIQQIPPNMALNALALILTLYIMAPVGMASYENIMQQEVVMEDMESLKSALDRGLGPYKEFLVKHSSRKEREFFMEAAKELWAEEYHQDIHEDNIIILLPAFIVAELTVAFEIGFLLYLPFVVIDLIISNILLAMGMMMMSPMTISLPFKLLLFVFLDGWGRLVHGLIMSYQ